MRYSDLPVADQPEEVQPALPAFYTAASVDGDSDESWDTTDILSIDLEQLA